MADLRAVLDAVGSERPVLAGLIEGGASAALFAASNPERVQSIVWWGPAARSLWSPDYPWGVRPEYVEVNERELQHWGTLEGARTWAEGEALYGRVFTEEEILWYAKLSRATGTPDVARELTRIWYETDVRSVLPSVNVPTLLLDQQLTPDDVEETQYIASLMPRAEFKPLPRDEALSRLYRQWRTRSDVSRASNLRCLSWIRSSLRSCSPTSWPRPRSSPL